MTLVLSLTDSERAFQFSDRRLTNAATGVPVDEEAAKASLIVCNDARVLMGFTGLATIGRETTQRWLLAKVGDQPSALSQVVDGLQDALSRRFAVLFGIQPVHRRLSVLMNGFLYRSETESVPVVILISNFEDPTSGPAAASPWPEFRVSTWTGGEGSDVLTLAVGAWSAVALPELEALKGLMLAGVPNKGVLGKGVELMVAAAKSPQSEGTVGTDIMTAVLPVDPQVQPGGGYVPEQAKMATYFLDQVIVGQISISDAKIEPVEATTLPTAVPPAPRNRPCPCGSGHKYKHCHGNWKGRPRGPRIV